MNVEHRVQIILANPVSKAIMNPDKFEPVFLGTPDFQEFYFMDRMHSIWDDYEQPPRIIGVQEDGTKVYCVFNRREEANKPSPKEISFLKNCRNFGESRENFYKSLNMFVGFDERNLEQAIITDVNPYIPSINGARIDYSINGESGTLVMPRSANFSPFVKMKGESGKKVLNEIKVRKI